MAEEEAGRVLAFPRAPEAIELRHLRAFVAVAEELNFGRAADRLYLSQPALSRQISGLERLVGCDLLRRTTHRVELTLAGEALLDRARRVLGDVDEAVSAAQSVGGELVTRAARMWAPLTELSLADGDLQEMRARYEEMHGRFEPPEGVAVRSVNAGGVPGFSLTPPGASDVELLYLHGGGYVMGSAYGYRHLAGALAAAAGTGALVPEYRLAPEHPFPAALEDAARAYTSMLDHVQDARRLLVAGDSVGGGLTLSLLLTLREQRIALPGGLILFSPGIDMSGATLADIDPNDPVAVQIRDWHGRITDAYLAGHPVDDPVVDALRADLTGLPPMLIQSATADPTLEDARRLSERARSHGVDARLELYPGNAHVFQTFWSFLPEAADAVRRAGEFARETRMATRAA
jgi:epsilon-lactone hydrolase